ncbi:MAG: hypothetical protein HRU33_09440 [Rhodobacteraceae bacterium]|nr:hypothetical protein [Paracoccaceae bacterium]
MLTISINEREIDFIELIRLALSEGSIEERVQAIKNVKQDVVAWRINMLSGEHGTCWASDPNNAEFVQWVAKSSAERHEASFEFLLTTRRYEDKNNHKLNIAEHIGELIWLSIQDEKFEGVQTDRGILQQVRDDAKESGVRGARDRDTLRKIWNTYRGVVHLGRAIDFCENYPEQKWDVLHLAELFRKGLSENCPKGTSKPYVSPDDQISFVYSSKLSGPRFRDRGLPFNVE